MKPLIVAIALFCASAIVVAQQQSPNDFKLALTEHKGQLQWHAEGFKVIQSSAKPGGREIGIRGKDSSGRLTFLGFLFLAPEGAPQSGTKCREQAIEYARKNTSSLKILGTSESTPQSGLPVALATYTTKTQIGSTEYNVRGFIATDDICGDLDFYRKESVRRSPPS